MSVSIFLALAGGCLIFYCLYSPKTSKIALCLSLFCVLIILIGYKNPDTYQNPDNFSKEYKLSVAGRGETLAQVSLRLSQLSPLEQGGDFLTTVLGIMLIFAPAVIEKIKEMEENQKYVKLIINKCLSLLMGVCLYLLSLHFGLEINLLPLIKIKKLQSRKHILHMA